MSKQDWIEVWGIAKFMVKAWAYCLAFLAIVFLIMLFCSGCASYSKSGKWTPDSVNYTISRDRQTGDLTDYFGASWQLK